MYGLGLEDARIHVLETLRSERYSLFGHLSLMLFFLSCYPLVAFSHLVSFLMASFRLTMEVLIA
jgi:hypothetical protein